MPTPKQPVKFKTGDRVAEKPKPTELQTMTDLSPATQAVLNALGCTQNLNALDIVKKGIAAIALRSAASQVAPLDYQSFFSSKEFNKGLEVRNEVIYYQLLDIADELENG